jgi:hypothetical protein
MACRLSMTPMVMHPHQALCRHYKRSGHRLHTSPSTHLRQECSQRSLFGLPSLQHTPSIKSVSSSRTSQRGSVALGIYSCASFMFQSVVKNLIRYLTVQPGSMEAQLLCKHVSNTLVSKNAVEAMLRTYWTSVCSFQGAKHTSSFRMCLESSNCKIVQLEMANVMAMLHRGCCWWC